MTVSIDPHNLLLGRMNAPGEDARLGRCLVTRLAQDRRSVDTRAAETSEQLFPGTVLSHQPHRHGSPTQRSDVGDSVRSPTRNHLRPIVVQDEDGSLAAYAGDTAVDVLIGNQIDDRQHFDSAESIDEIEEPPARGFVLHALASEDMSENMSIRAE